MDLLVVIVSLFEVQFSGQWTPPKLPAQVSTTKTGEGAEV
jgi:hypothetical protein